ncbi:type II toxin-antitoxin system HicB family antitoxin [Cetobacterium sp. 2A]|uniref:type II toxin-antitoxin system HicB family antitoxin n=1 Tax=Cetobacterium sp. 2A TaxID=2754723 RepID=UPI00163C507E|nr:type II toxin-antitoxin system HicB family antitoxin [Cetobacterium sp. 2A]MBC2856965.1 type II toxin-antitoxin system HicB family antitoxin [Cetobacterium sp. 2A]
MKKDKYIYPAIFEEEDGGFNISFPDLPGALTYGDTLEEALFMAKDCLGLYLYSLESRNIDIPNESKPQDIKVEPTSFVQLIEVFMAPIRDDENNKSVRRNVTLPKWLNELAKKNKINVSAILEASLKMKLGI